MTHWTLKSIYRQHRQHYRNQETLTQDKEFVYNLYWPTTRHRYTHSIMDYTHVDERFVCTINYWALTWIYYAIIGFPYTEIDFAFSRLQRIKCARNPPLAIACSFIVLTHPDPTIHHQSRGYQWRKIINSVYIQCKLKKKNIHKTVLCFVIAPLRMI